MDYHLKCFIMFSESYENKCKKYLNRNVAQDNFFYEDNEPKTLIGKVEDFLKYNQYTYTKSEDLEYNQYDKDYYYIIYYDYEKESMVSTIKQFDYDEDFLEMFDRICNGKLTK